MSTRDILDAIDAAGAALIATGEATISLRSYSVGEEQRFSVGVRSAAEKHYVPDCFGHGSTPRAALADALAQRHQKDDADRIQAERRARFEAWEREQEAVAA